MTCTICKNGQTTTGHTTVTLERGSTTLVFKQVPADVCGNCGEAYVDEAIAARLLQDATAAAAQGVELEVHRFQAA